MPFFSNGHNTTMRTKHVVGSGIGSRGEVAEYNREMLVRLVENCRPKSLLDVGCGDQNVSQVLPDNGYLAAPPNSKRPAPIRMALRFGAMQIVLLVELSICCNYQGSGNFSGRSQWSSR